MDTKTNDVIDLLLHAEEKGVSLFLEGNKLRYTLAAGTTLDQEMIATLKEYKEEIIHFLSRSAGDFKSVNVVREKITAFNRDDFEGLPLSFSQERLWFIDKLEGSSHYHLPMVLRFQGNLNPEILTFAFKEIVNRHEILRTVYVEQDGEVFQQILDRNQWQLQYSENAGPEDKEETANFIAQATSAPFDLSQDHMLRAHLRKMNEDEYLLVLVQHHIASDGWSIPIFVNELTELYTAKSENRWPRLKPLPIQYVDYAIWQRTYLEKELLGKELEYWENKLAGIEHLNLLTDFPRPAIQSTRGSSLNITFKKSLSRQLLQRSKEENVTMFMLLLAAFKVLLYRYTRQADICVGSPIANRTQKELEPLVGFFVNTLALRSDLDGNPSFNELLKQVKDTTLEAYDHQHTPFEKIVEKVVTERDRSRSPLFQTLFVLENNPDLKTVELGDSHQAEEGVALSAENIELTTAKFDLTFSINQRGENTSLSIEYCSDLFLPETIERLAQHFESLLSAIALNPQERIDQLPLLSQAEQQQLLVGFNDTEEDYPTEKTIVDLFEEQVQKTPDAIAISFEETTLTYEELSEKSNQLGHYLREQGVREETLVGICIDRSLEMMIGLLGILKSGGAYVPIDPEYPQERITYMVENANASIILSNQSSSEVLQGLDGEIILLDQDWDKISTFSTQKVTTDLQPEHLMYVLYTSGSTGKPKGVMNQHSGVVNRLLWAQSEYQLEGGIDVVLQKTTFCFDVSVWELFWPLLVGVKLVFAKPGGHKDNRYLQEVIDAEKVTTMHFVPSMLEVYLLSVEKGMNNSLKRVLCSGEALKPSHVAAFQEKLNTVELHNLYGPTEAAIDVSYWPVPNEAVTQVSIGKPVANTQLYIVDTSDQLVPVGVPGELLIGGIQVARGYWSRPDLTADRFVDNPYDTTSKTKLYRTGDLARWQPNGEIEYLGRIDSQVKIRGYRIELGEIEAVLQESALVHQGLVLVKTDTVGNDRLVAYIVPTEAFDQKAIQQYLESRLPDYMVPPLYVELTEIPLTPNGKINRKALPNPDASELLEGQYVAPSNEHELQLAEIWKSHLGVDRVGIHDNFFALGGHSLLAIKITNAIEKTFEVKLSLGAFFSHPQVEKQAALIAQSEAEIYTPIHSAPQQANYPLSPAQNRMFILQQFDEESIVYNIPMSIPMPKAYSKQAIEQAIQTLVQRHEGLRSSFELSNGAPVQVVQESVEVVVEDLTGLSLSDAMNRFVQPFNLSQAPLFRVGYLEYEEGLPTLFFDIHHILTDGESQKVLGSELMALLEGNDLPAVKVQYKDYVAWQLEEAQQERQKEEEIFWLNTFAEPIPALDLAIDYPRPEFQSFAGRNANFRLSSEEQSIIDRLADQSNSTKYQVLLSIWIILLSKISNEADITVGTPVAGRRHPDLERVIGMFVNTLPLRNQVTQDESYLTFLSKVKANFIAAFEQQDYPFEQLVEQIWDGRIKDRNPIFDTMFSLVKEGQQEVSLGTDSTAVYFSEQSSIAKFDLMLTAIDSRQGLGFSLEYGTHLYQEDTIARFVSCFRQIIHSLGESSNQALGKINFLSKEEKEQLLFEFNNTTVAYAQDKNVIELFEAQVLKSPEHPALVFGEEVLTYQELNERANQLAHYLLAKGVKHQDKVGILTYRSIEMVVSVFGVLKCGGIYVPLNTEYPTSRLNYILNDASIQQVICTHAGLLKESGLSGCDFLTIEESAEYPTIAPNIAATTEDIASVMYTSGTTGDPKGILVGHQNIVKLASEQNEMAITEEDRVLQWSNFSFDGSTYDIYNSLLNGASLYLISESDAPDPSRLAEIIQQNDLTVALMTTALFNAFVDYDMTPLHGLRKWLFGGEKVSVNHVKKALAELGTDKIIHAYGPTETTVYASYLPVNSCEENRMPIGRPLSNTQVYIVNKSTQLCGIGMVGEIWVGGEGVTQGYLNRPELTAEKFIVNPFLPEGNTLYRTGDLARLLADGNVDFVGRKDSQIKMRGYRIELGEIEAVLHESPLVKQSVVTAREDVTGTRRLVAYIVPEGAFDKAGIQADAKASLPEYMVPSLIVELSEMPLTPNGKVNKKALPEPDVSELVTSEYQAPRTETEKKLVQIWTELLEVDKVGIEDNFFELGGHSLLAIKVTNRIEQLLDVKLSMRSFLSHTVIKELAQVVDVSSPAIYNAILPAPTQAHYPLSSAQSRMFILQQFDDQSIAYNIPMSIPLDKAYSKQEVTTALTTLVQRHEGLRSSFELLDGEPIQIVRESVEIVIEDLTGLSMTEAMGRFVRPFDLAQAPLFRVGYLEYETGLPTLFFDLHHILTDGESQKVLGAELMTLLQGNTLPEVKVQYKDYVYWLNSEAQQTTLKTQEDFWLNVFAEEAPLLELPTDYTRPSLQNFAGSHAHFSMTDAELETIDALAKTSGSTRYQILLSVWTILLGKLGNTSDVTVGTPLAGRRHPDLERVIGMFVNTLALRNQLDKDQTFLTFLSKVKESFVAAYENQDYPFEQLVEKIWDGRIKDRNPIFDTMFALVNGTAETHSTTTTEEITFGRTDDIVKFDLHLTALDQDNKLSFSLGYSTKLFAENTIERIVRYFRQIIHSLGENAQQKLGDIELLSTLEKEQLLFDFNNATANYPTDKTIVDLFEEQVQDRPEAIAITCEGASLTYQALDEKSNQLAHYLRNEGVREDHLIGICIDRSLEMMIGLFGILKSGGAYVPIDPEYPQDRIAYMLEDTSASIILSNESSRTVLENQEDKVILLDTDWSKIATFSKEKVATNLRPDNLMYVLYTSGSTGKPKGVMNQHSGLVNRLLWAQSEYQLIPEKDVVLQKTTFCFDVSVWELFWPLLVGVKLVFAKPGGHKDNRYLQEVIEAEGVTTMHFVPSMLEVYLLSLEKNTTTCLKRVLCSGEALKPSHVAQFQEKLSSVALHNLYGPTEAAIDVTYWPIPNEKVVKVPIGKPVANTQIYIVDPSNNLVPIGVPGELLIGGVQVARGYLNRPALSADRFVNNPFDNNTKEKVYRTGDLARWQSNGEVEYLGRIDSQVKIRGYRIELGEIESVIQELANISQALVLVKKSASDDQQLVAYVVPEDDAYDQKAIQGHLESRLPDYMVPALYVELAEIPLTPNGKVNRKALPDPDASALLENQYVAPSSEQEAQLAAIWKLHLGVERVGIRDNFFALGGHSLLAIKITNEIEKVFEIKLSLGDFFSNPFVEEQVKLITQSESTSYQPITPAAVQTDYPLSPAQNRMFILQQFDPYSTTYNIPLSIPLDGPYSKEELLKALTTLVQRHEGLRSSFKLLADEPVQIVHESVDFELESLSGSSVDEAMGQFIRPFDLSQAPLFRVGYLEHEGGFPNLFFDVHHILTDGESQKVLGTELLALLHGETLAPVKVQYKDYVQWQLEPSQQEQQQLEEAFWLSTFAEAIPALDLATDYPRPEFQQFTGRTAYFSLTEKEQSIIDTLLIQSNSTTYQVLLSIWIILLSKISNEEDVTVGTPIAGRRHPDLERVVGMFVNTLPLRNPVTQDQVYLDFLASIKSNFITAFENQDYPFEQLVEKVWDGRIKDRNPVFDTMFALFKEEYEEATERADSSEVSFNNKVDIAKFDLTMQALDNGQRLGFSLEFASHLYEESTIARFVGYFRQIILSLGESLDQTIGEITILSKEEEQKVRLDFNQTTMSYPLDKTLMERFEAQVLESPNHPAVVFGSKVLSYRELNERANQLGHYLVEQGVKPQDKVGILAYRSLEMMVSIFGILKSGAIYVPLNTEYPTSRLSYILEDSSVSQIIYTHADLLGESGLADLPGYQFISADECSAHPTDTPEVNTSIKDIAYVMYTSGTTGEPKGILVDNQNIMKLALEQNEIAITKNDRVLQWSNYAFDGSTYDIYNTLLNGASLYLISEANASDPSRLAEIVQENALTVSFMTTALFNAFVDYDVAALKDLRKLLFGGEKVSIPHVRRAFNELGPDKIIHVYGPTETTVYATYFPINNCDQNSVPIGRPLSNTQMYVVNKTGQLCGVGMIGEVWIGGDGVTQGYLNRPELTAEKFIPNPFTEKEERLYRTGDLVRLMADGSIDFVGRKDNQIKMRGYRIELGEIETVLHESNLVKQSIVLAREDVTGTRRLVAYIVPNGSFDKAGIQADAKASLPEYMVPSQIVELEEMPLTPNGKIDKRALLEPDVSALLTTEYHAPKTEVEQQLAVIWQDILEVEQIGVRDNFFELGGHSLLAIKVTNRIEQLLGVKLTMGTFFSHTVIEDLAEVIEISGRSVYTEITPAPIEPYYPLSPAQNRMFILQQFDEQSTVYNIPLNIALDRPYAKKEIKKVLKTLVQRHEGLRSSFELLNGEPIQIVHETVNIEIEELKGTSLHAVMKKFVRPFDLSQAPLFRVGYLSHKGGLPTLFFDFHHILTDGESQKVLGAELMSLLQGIDLPPVKVQYKDYVHWLNTPEQQSALQTQEDFWMNTFAEEVPFLELPLDHPRPELQGFDGSYAEVYLSKEETRFLHDLAQQNGTTIYTILLSIWTLLLSKLTNQTDLVVGTPVAGRRHPDLEQVVGMFVNTLPIRTKLDRGQSFSEFLGGVHNDFMAAFDNQDYPFEKIVERIWDSRIKNRNPMFDTMFALVNEHAEANVAASKTGQIHFSEISSVAKFDLSLTATDYEDQLNLNLEYSTQLFEEATIGRLINYFRNIISYLKNNENPQLKEIDILSKAERKQLLNTFNGKPSVYTDDQTLVELLEDSFDQSSQKTALIFKDQTLSYQTLDERSNQLAHYLRKQGIKEESLVAICMDHSIEMIVAILGVLKSGGAYVPIDPSFPKDRIQYILSDVDAEIVITNPPAQFEKISPTDRLRLLDFKLEQTEISQESKERVANNLKPEHLAYVIYTSGSTGMPKGVMVTHGSIAVRLQDEKDLLHLDENLTTCLITNYIFDVALLEIFLPLLSGGRLMVARREDHYDPAKLLDSIAKAGVTKLQGTPSTISNLVDVIDENIAAKLQLTRICIGGESLNSNLVEKIKGKLPQVEINNHYGPTETTIDTIVYTDVQSFSRNIIGKPIANTTAYVVDQDRNLVPVGVAGELLLGGLGVSRGYLNRPELTAEKFISDPFSTKEGARLYCTGDLVRWLPTGEIEFIGRIDGQVKIRGYRVELGEIESTLQKSEAVTQGVVLLKKDEMDQKRLIAYVIANGDFDKGKVQEEMQAQLPEYMVPSFFVVMDQMPLTSNGKVDRRALPNPDISELLTTEYHAPETKLEQQLASIWLEVLKADRVGIRDNFFELGGHSLLAIKVTNRIEQHLGVKLSMGAFFKHTNIKELAEVIETSSQATYTAIPPAPNEPYYPLSPAQNRMFILQQFNELSTVYNVPLNIPLDQKYSKKRIKEVLNILVQRHEGLRSSFELLNGEPIQIVHKFVKIEIEELKGSSIPEIMEKFVRPFDLSELPLFRVGYLAHKGGLPTLFFDFHHILTDGESQNILGKELMALLQNAPLPDVKVQYKDYVHWLNSPQQKAALQGQEDFWMDVFAEEIPLLELPTDRPRPDLQGFDGSFAEIYLAKEEILVLDDLAQNNGTTVYTVLLSIWTLLLSKLTNQTDLVVGTPVAGRRHPDLEQVVGMFVNTLPVRTKMDRSQSFDDFLALVHHNFMSAFENQDYPFEKIVERVWDSRIKNRNPMFDTMFALVNEDMVGDSKEVNTSEIYFSKTSSIAKFDLSLTATNFQNQLNLNIEYSTQLFDEATVGRLIGYFRNIISFLKKNNNPSLKEVDILSRVELDFFKKQPPLYTKKETLIDLLEDSFAQSTQKTALIFNDQTLSYQDLDERSNQLAHYLRKAGVKEESPVAICMDRSFEMIITILGILKAGGAYVPIDPEFPTDRIQYILSDVQAEIVITNAVLQTQEVATIEAIRLLDLEREQIAINRESRERVATNLSAEHLAYILYTSGSTGMPKGVMVPHASIAMRLQDESELLELDEHSVTCLLTNYIFDVSLLEIFLPLLQGGRVLIPQKEERYNPTKLLGTLAKAGVTKLQGTPSTIANLIDVIDETMAASLQLNRICIGGESLNSDLVAKIKSKLPQVKINNHYGPTETTIDTIVYSDIESFSRNIIGKPIKNSAAYIVDGDRNLVPIGVTGELLLGGPGVSRGYLNRPELTAEKFIADPYSTAPNARLYCTGDLVRWLSSGEIEFVGRIDDQVKIRGYRIELGEIEAALQKSEAVKQGVVLVKKDQMDQKRLVAYVAAKDTFSKEKVQEEMRTQLPAYMIPSFFIVLDELPLTANDKVDRKALPSPDFTGVLMEKYTAPRNKTEKQLAQIWSKCLQLEKVGIQDNFFELGGHSLLAIKLIAKINQTFSTEWRMAALFESPTIELLAQRMAGPDISDRTSILIKMKQGTSTKKVFCVPGAEGNIMAFSAFSQTMQEYTSYVFQPPGSDGKSALLKTVEEMATAYIDAMQKIDAVGPYTLGGYSFGGEIAYEMAQQLTERGFEVNQLILFDSVAPINRKKEAQQKSYEKWLTYFAIALAESHGKKIELKPEMLEQKLRVRQLEFLHGELKALGINLSLSEIRNLSAVYINNVSCVYQPNWAQRLAVPTLLFRAQQKKEKSNFGWKTLLKKVKGINAPKSIEQLKDYGWGRLTSDAVKVYDLESTHWTILKKPSILKISEIIRENHF